MPAPATTQSASHSTNTSKLSASTPQSSRQQAPIVLAQSAEVFATLTSLNRGNLLKELLKDPDLLHQGEGEESSGSDSEPSDDNLEPEELAQLIPVAEKSDLASGKKPLSKTSSRTIIKPVSQKVTVSKSKVKKCPECGKDMFPHHKCPPKPAPVEKPKDSAKPPTATVSQRRPTVGVRTYYNLLGKRVHDQATQTPASFYLNYKLMKQREKEARSARSQVTISPTGSVIFTSGEEGHRTDSILHDPPLSPLPHSVRSTDAKENSLTLSRTGPMLGIEGQISRDRLSYGNLQAVKRGLFQEKLRHSSVTGGSAKESRL